jgi:ER lumen protein retaining receptor
MNFFRFIADMLHLAAIMILLYRIKKSRNCIGKVFYLSLKFIIGLSCRTQELYLIVFCLRYLDLFMYFISLYNTSMKIFYIGTTALVIYLMRYKKPFCTVNNLNILIFVFRLMMLLVTISLTLKFYYPQLS